MPLTKICLCFLLIICVQRSLSARRPAVGIRPSFPHPQPQYCGAGQQDCGGRRMFDWNDLRFLLAVACEGSTIAAARALNVNQSTVQRRLAELEAKLGHRLVERLPSGYHLTEFGAAVLPQAQNVAAAIEGFAHSVEEQSRALGRIVRVTCPEPIVFRLTQSGLLDKFHTAYPKLKIAFVLTDKYVDLAKGEADVALRSGDTEDSVLVGHKIANLLWALYASHDYVAQYGAPASITAFFAGQCARLSRSCRIFGLCPNMRSHWDGKDNGAYSVKAIAVNYLSRADRLDARRGNRVFASVPIKHSFRFPRKESLVARSSLLCRKTTPTASTP